MDLKTNEDFEDYMWRIVAYNRDARPTQITVQQWNSLPAADRRTFPGLGGHGVIRVARLRGDRQKVELVKS